MSKKDTNMGFNTGQEKKNAFITEFRQLLAKYKAELTIEDLGSDFISDEKMVATFEWDEDISNKTDSGIIESWVIGCRVNGG